MTEVQMTHQLKFRISSLESQLVEKQKQIDEYKTVESEADSKIKALNRMQTQKVKNLLNSIQILKKEKASIQGMSKQHKRSKLIEQLNKEIGDQDMVIEILRKLTYDREGREKGRVLCDQLIIKALTKGPQRIRPLSREELRMELDKLKSINLHLEAKLKNGPSGKANNRNRDDDSLSAISDMSQQSFVNHNEVVLNRLKDFQFQNENMKLQVNAKMKIIEKLKNDIKDKDKLKAEIQILNNEIHISNKKVTTYERLMKESKEHTNSKIIQLYEREIKVQELEMVSKQNTDKLKQVQQGHNILSEELRLEKQKVQAQLEALKKENQQLILDNITNRRRQDDQKNKINEIRDLNVKQKDQLKDKLEFYEGETLKVAEQNQKLLESYRRVEQDLFSERAKWVEAKADFIKELEEMRAQKGQGQLIGKHMIDIDQLTQENRKLRQIIEQGGTGEGGSDTLLLQRLESYKRRLDFIESKSEGKTESGDYYTDMFKRFNELTEEFQEYKSKYGKHPRKSKGKQFVEINKAEEEMYEHLSSGISKLNLGDVDSDLLDNFDSSYQFQIVVTEDGRKVRIPKVTDADKELLKLINSDLWDFVEDQGIEMGRKLDEVSLAYSDNEEDYAQTEELKNRVRKIKNLSHPKGKKVVIYEQQVMNLDDISDGVSVTSGLAKELDKYDSDIDLEFRKVDYEVPKNLNLFNLKNMSMSSGSSVAISNVRSGDSRTFKKRQQQSKASVIGIRNPRLQKISSDVDSVDENQMLNSDVSSFGISEGQLNKMDSDIEGDFGKNKP